MTMAASYHSFDLTPPLPPPTRHPPAPHKDYSRPLHVDCSVEYELPNQAKPPEGSHSEPLLMIHPCYYRRAESQRRSPFINNLPSRGNVNVGVLMTGSSGSSRRATTATATATAATAPQHYPPTVRYSIDAWTQQQHAMLEPAGSTLGVSMYAKVPTQGCKAGGGGGKRDPLLCGGGEFSSSGSDSGVSAGHWTDSDRSPDVRLREYQATDSGVATPVSADDKNVLLSDLLLHDPRAKEVHLLPRHRHHARLLPSTALCQDAAYLPQQKLHPQPAVGVAAVAASTSCKTCRPPTQYQRLLQQPWAGVTAPTAATQFQHPAVAVAVVPGRMRGSARAVEPGPEHAASRRALPAWGRTTASGGGGGGSAAKRSRTAAHAQEVMATTNWSQYLQNPVVVTQEPVWTSAACPLNGKDFGGAGEATAEWAADNGGGGYYTATAAGQCARGIAEDNTRILWNNESMLRLFQV